MGLMMAHCTRIDCGGVCFDYFPSSSIGCRFSHLSMKMKVVKVEMDLNIKVATIVLDALPLRKKCDINATADTYHVFIGHLICAGVTDFGVLFFLRSFILALNSALTLLIHVHRYNRR